MVCDKVVCESGRGGGGGRGGIQNQKQEPHTKMWGKKTRRRMARERRGAGSSAVSIETLYHKTRSIIGRREE